MLETGGWLGCQFFPITTYQRTDLCPHTKSTSACYRTWTTQKRLANIRTLTLHLRYKRRVWCLKLCCRYSLRLRLVSEKVERTRLLTYFLEHIAMYYCNTSENILTDLSAAVFIRTDFRLRTSASSLSQTWLSWFILLVFLTYFGSCLICDQSSAMCYNNLHIFCFQPDETLYWMNSVVK